MTWSGLEVNAFHQMANSVNASRLTMVSLLMEVLDAIRSNSVIQVFRVISLLALMHLNRHRSVFS